MLRSQRGFSLIEMMVVAAILGILAMIATDAYTKMANRSKKTYAKTALMKAYAGEMNFLAEHHTFTQCLQYAGGFPPDVTAPPPQSPRFYYVGFATINAANVCGRTGNQTCLGTNYSSSPLPTCSCPAPAGGSFSPCAYDANMQTMVSAATALSSASAERWTVNNSGSFTLGAIGHIGGSQNDAWTINQLKELKNVQAGE